MRFVYSSGFIYGDRKPSRILLNRRGEALIADIGTVRPEQYDSTWAVETGSAHYAAPEQYRDEIECTNKADVFAFGSTVYEILVGSAVFPSSMDHFPLIMILLKGKMPVVPDKCGSLMQKLISRCCAMNPADRPSFDHILNAFGAQNFGIISGAHSASIECFLCGSLAWEARARSPAELYRDSAERA